MNTTSAKLPHDPITHHAVHITYRLAGSVPKGQLAILRSRRDRALARLEVSLLGVPEPLYTENWNKQTYHINVNYELAVEEVLHQGGTGPRHLGRDDIACLVLQSWLTLHERQAIFLYAVCIMSNHVHVVLQAPGGVEQVAIGKLMKAHKGYTARMANRLLGTTGKSFWANTYFDRRVRRGRFMRVMWYVINNPVKAGLVSDWQQWPYTYVSPQCRELFTGVLEEE